MCITPQLFTGQVTGIQAGMDIIIIRDRRHGVFTCGGTPGAVGDLVSVIVMGLFASPSVVAAGIEAAGGVPDVIGGIAAGIDTATDAGAMPATVRAIVQGVAMPRSRICTEASATRHG